MADSTVNRIISEAFLKLYEEQLVSNRQRFCLEKSDNTILEENTAYLAVARELLELHMEYRDKQ